MSASPDFTEIAAELGLPVSRLVSSSKSGYRARHPDNAVVFNATIADEDGNRLWWGDVDLAHDEAALRELARRVGIDLYLYFEGDSRRGFVEVIQRSNAVVAARADGEMLFGDRVPLKRDGAGRIVRDHAEPPATAPGSQPR